MSYILKINNMASESVQNNNRSDVWHSFTKSVTDGITYGSCNFCKTTFKCLYGSTSCLRNHLKSAHTAVYVKLVEKEAAKRKIESELKEVCDNVTLIYLAQFTKCSCAENLNLCNGWETGREMRRSKHSSGLWVREGSLFVLS
jgi:BED zinc finger